MSAWVERFRTEMLDKISRAFVGMGKPIGHDVQFLTFRDFEEMFEPFGGRLVQLEWRTRCDEPGFGTIETECRMRISFTPRYYGEWCRVPTLIEVAELLQPRGMGVIEHRPDSWSHVAMPRRVRGDLPAAPLARTLGGESLDLVCACFKQRGDT